MPSSPLVSIIIPVYNIATYLPACLDSLAAQTFSSFEVIAVNDGSTDNSADILKQYLSRLPHLRIVAQTNQGAAVARQTGLACAQGEAVCFVDGDDVVSADYLEKLWTAYQEAGPTGLALACMISFTQEPVSPGSEVPEIFRARSVSGASRVRVFEDFSAAMALCGKLFSRVLAQQLPLPKGLTTGDDICPSVLVLAQSEKIVPVADAYYFYRQRAGSCAHSPGAFAGLLEGFCLARQALQKHEKYTLFAPGFEYICRVCLLSFMEKYGLTQDEESFLRTHRADLQVPPDLFALRPFKFRVRQWLFEKSLKGYFSYSCLMHGLHRLMHRTQKASEVAAKIG